MGDNNWVTIIMMNKIEFILAQQYLFCVFLIFQLMYPCEDPYGVCSETGDNSLRLYWFSQRSTEKSIIQMTKMGFWAYIHWENKYQLMPRIN